MEIRGVYYELSGKPGVHRQNHQGNSQCPGTGSYVRADETSWKSTG